jgi:hypothetical protein
VCPAPLLELIKNHDLTPTTNLKFIPGVIDIKRAVAPGSPDYENFFPIFIPDNFAMVSIQAIFFNSRQISAFKNSINFSSI